MAKIRWVGLCWNWRGCGVEVLEALTGYGRTQTGGRFLICPCELFSDLQKLQPDSSKFALLTLFDLADVQSDEMALIARVLVERGLAYACCWGEDCERWHDSIDTADIEHIDARGGDSRDIIMTTWHDDESMREALHFFETCALPAEGNIDGCKDYVVATPSRYEAEVRRYFCYGPVSSC
jgi:hypothetical protein